MLLERRGPKAPRAGTECKAPWGSRGRLGPPAPLGRTETRVKSGSPDRKAARATKEKMVLPAPQAFRVPSAPLELLEVTGNQGPEVSRGCLDRKGMREQEASRDPLVPSVFRVCQAHLVKKVKMGMSVPWVHLALPAPEVPKVPTELMDPKDLQDPLVPLVVLEKRVNLEKRETQGRPGKQAPGAPKENEARKGKRGPPARLDLPAPRGRQGTMARKATRVLLVFLETQVLPASPALRVKMVLVVTRVRMETPGSRVLLAPLVRRAHQVLLGKEVLREQQVQRDGKGKRAPRGKQVPKVLPGRLAQLVLRAPPGSPVRRAFGASPGLWENKVSPELQAKTGRPVPWDPPDYLASKGTLAPRARRGILV